ncbi:MAG TPA: HD domain-containing phosphohydrolase [Longimicrobium sp.]|nr:HD domain-containing phosphohydrolase [Longimicrobium sp.]
MSTAGDDIPGFDRSDEDLVLSRMHAAASAYRDARADWARERDARDRALTVALTERDAAQRERDTARGERDVAREERDAVRVELQEAVAAAERQGARAEALRDALKEIHRSLFTGNVYEMILRSCLTITGAARGVYVTRRVADGRLRVRAAVGMENGAGGEVNAEPSPFIHALCDRVLEGNEPLVCNDGAGDGAPGLPAAGPGERFRNYAASPVVLMRNLDGILVVADKAVGRFDPEDVETLLSVGDQAAVAVENRHLEKALQSAYVATVSLLADAVEAKDPYTHGHCEMASRFARLVAERLQLPADERAVVCYAALLHDVGKIGVSDGVLHKPGPLLPEEVQLMRAHVRVGHDLLSGVPALRAIADVVLHHHERYDGAGYPDGLRGEEIPVAARIVAAVDAYCAMITRRVYKEAFSEEEARGELVRCSGTQFDPVVVEALLAVLDTPEAADADDDDWAECSLLPAFVRERGSRAGAAA